MAESYTGQIRDGVVVFDEGTPPLPSGTRVRITAELAVDGAEPEDGPTLYDRLKPIVGSDRGLPADLAEQHDHYIHGTPKR